MFYKKNNKEFILISIFLALLVMPNIVMFFNYKNTKKLPDFNINHPKRSIILYKNYYQENFGLKSSLVKYYTHVKNNVLEENPIPHRVIKGKNDWFFLGNFYSNAIDKSFGLKAFSSNELEQLITKLQEIQKYLKSKDIAFYIVIPPNKHNLYQENLPYKLEQKTTKLEQLINALPKDLRSLFIDLTPVLKPLKKDKQLYISTDSHWNDYGAYQGYKTVIDSINTNIPINKITLDDYNLIEDTTNIGDLMKVIKSSKKTTTIKLEKKIKTNITLLEHSYKKTHFKNNSINNHLKLIMHHDSFTYAWQKYFNESFEEIIYLQTDIIDDALIEKEKPNIFIIEIIERNLENLSRLKIIKKK